LVTRFLPGQRNTLFFVAGTLRLPYRTFFLWDGVAAALHVTVLVYGARALGWRWQSLQAPFSRADDVLTAALVLVLFALWLRGRRRRIEEL
jgi:membrane protein DedA with SNARE-associated domain